MTREEAWEQVERLCPTASDDLKLNMVNLMTGFRKPRQKRDGQRTKVYGRVTYLTVNVRPSRSKRQRIYRSEGLGARMWRDSEARLRGDTSYLEAQEVEKTIRKEKIKRHYDEFISMYTKRESDMAEEAANELKAQKRDRLFKTKGKKGEKG